MVGIWNQGKRVVSIVTALAVTVSVLFSVATFHSDAYAKGTHAPKVSLHLHMDEDGETMHLHQEGCVATCEWRTDLAGVVTVPVYTAFVPGLLSDVIPACVAFGPPHRPPQA